MNPLPRPRLLGESQRLMRRFSGSCRHVYNKALALQQELLFFR